MIEREFFLIYFAKIIDEKEDHAIYYKKENIFIFYFEKTFYEMILTKEKEHKTFGEKSKVLLYEATWGFKSIKPRDSNLKEIKKLLKEALFIYGNIGIFSKDEKRKIEFKF